MEGKEGEMGHKSYAGRGESKSCNEYRVKRGNYADLGMVTVWDRQRNSQHVDFALALRPRKIAGTKRARWVFLGSSNHSAVPISRLRFHVSLPRRARDLHDRDKAGDLEGGVFLFLQTSNL